MKTIGLSFLLWLALFSTTVSADTIHATDTTVPTETPDSKKGISRVEITDDIADTIFGPNKNEKQQRKVLAATLLITGVVAAGGILTLYLLNNKEPVK